MGDPEAGVDAGAHLRDLLAAPIGDAYAGAVAVTGTAAGIERRVTVGERADGEPVTLDTRFDCASLTKAVATTTLVLRRVERGDLALSATLGEFLPALAGAPRGEIPLRALLTHTSGLPPYKAFPFGWDSREAVVESLCDSPIALLADPGAFHCYSDLNFLFLGEVLRRTTGETLADLARHEIFEPLEMDAALGPVDAERTAATRDRRWRERTLRGEVHDYLAAAMGGAAGNAGLFATAPALARFARALLGDGGLGATRVLAPQSVARVRRDAVSDPDVRQGLGWRLADGTTPAPTWSDAAFGHTGFTGTSIWIDPPRDRFAVLLTTHLLPEDPTPMADLRERFHGAVGATRGDAAGDGDADCSSDGGERG